MATTGQVKELINTDLFAYYYRLLLQSTLMMADMVYWFQPQLQASHHVKVWLDLADLRQLKFHLLYLVLDDYHGVSPCKVSANVRN